MAQQLDHRLQGAPLAVLSFLLIWLSSVRCRTMINVSRPLGGHIRDAGASL
jgi:hypothetical protein